MRYAAVFFDAGETLVHPHPSFPDLLSEILIREGFDVPPERVRARAHVVYERFRSAAQANELWTTSPERSRRFWHEVYAIFFRELDVPNANGLIDVVYGEFTDLANYRLFDDVPDVLERGRAVADGVRQHQPPLDSMQQARVAHRRLLRVRDAQPGRAGAARCAPGPS